MGAVLVVCGCEFDGVGVVGAVLVVCSCEFDVVGIVVLWELLWWRVSVCLMELRC